MQNKTDDELKQIAIDLRAGRIYCDRHMTEAQDLAHVFMVLSFMDDKQIAELKAEPPGMIYEYLEKAGARSINGAPSFFSMQMLTQTDAEKVLTMVQKLKEAEQAVSA